MHYRDMGPTQIKPLLEKEPAKERGFRYYNKIPSGRPEPSISGSLDIIIPSHIMSQTGNGADTLLALFSFSFFLAKRRIISAFQNPSSQS